MIADGKLLEPRAAEQSSLHYFWPRAESNLYAEATRLVEAGLAEAREDWNGGRRRKVYSTTAAGRRELHEWLARPAAESRYESEAALRVFLGEQARRRISSLRSTASARMPKPGSRIGKRPPTITPKGAARSRTACT